VQHLQDCAPEHVAAHVVWVQVIGAVQVLGATHPMEQAAVAVQSIGEAQVPGPVHCTEQVEPPHWRVPQLLPKPQTMLQSVASEQLTPALQPPEVHVTAQGMPAGHVAPAHPDPHPILQTCTPATTVHVPPALVHADAQGGASKPVSTRTSGTSDEESRTDESGPPVSICVESTDGWLSPTPESSVAASLVPSPSV
jgi:hypothetical protein